MNFYRHLALLFVFTVGSSFGLSEYEQTDPCNIVNESFSEGEEIVYKIYYNWNFVWFSAGEVSFHVSETEENYEIIAYGKTYKSYEIFFKVNDVYRTTIDKKTLLPVEFERTIEEGGYRHYNRVEFDQNKGTALSFTGKTKEHVVAQEFPIESCMHDVLSTVYFMRNMTFDIMTDKEKFPVNMFLDDKVYPIQITYNGKDTKKIKGFGDVDVFKLNPELIAGMVFTNDAKMNVWVSDDGNKVPVIIESPISVGSIQAILKSHSGLKHPLGQG